MKRLAFQENVVIITGASLGLGRELALQLADQGAWLALAARDKSRLEEVAEHCRQRGARAIAVPTDITQEAQCADLVERTVAAYGRIDTLVNNAGITMVARFDEMKNLEAFEEVMRVNYFGSLYCTFHALKHLKASRGRVVGISSLSGLTGIPTRSGYCASKHAVTGFYDSLRTECEKGAPSVTVIYPGFISTGMRERGLGPDGNRLESGPHDESKMMTVERCCQLILNAMASRKRDLVMTSRGKFGRWLKLIAPGTVDKIARKGVREGR